MDRMNDAVVKGISLYPDEWMQLDQIASDNAINRSQAVRTVIREWSQQQLILSAVRAYDAGVITEREMARLALDAVNDNGEEDQA